MKQKIRFENVQNAKQLWNLLQSLTAEEQDNLKIEKTYSKNGKLKEVSIKI
tara:strand:- start:516 stop:668 length:153 start_codon:yes stop_codon:yes gene_type:complete